MRKLTSFSLLLALAASCATTPKTVLSPQAPGDNIVISKGRTIDLNPYLTGFPFTTYYSYPDLRTGHYFIKRKVGGEERLVMASFDPQGSAKIDLFQAPTISERDFTKRTFWGALWSPLTNRVVMKADESNDEIVNMYELDPKTGEERRLTSVSYIYNYRLSPDGRYLACTTRSAKEETSPGDVRIVDLITRTERIVYHDSKDIKMVWGGVSWRPDGRGLLVTFMHQSLRKQLNLLYVSLEEGEAPRVLTNTALTRTALYPLDVWKSNDDYLYVSDETGVAGIYRGSLAGGQTLLTTKDDIVKDAIALSDGDTVYVGAVVGTPLKSTLKLINSATGQTVYTETFEGTLDLRGAYGNQVAMMSDSLENPFTQYVVRIEKGKVSKYVLTGYPDDLLDKVVQCKVEKVSFPTFDRPVVPGEVNGMLHAYLLTPKQPLQGENRRALVYSFYGGANEYRSSFHVLCQAGYYVLSPAPRGTQDFGTAFYSLGDGDWGGGETLDDFAAGKFLATRLSLPPNKIGIFGGSRGGYDALRALTFPDEVNGIKEDFRFGFGISDFGISNVVRAYEQGNIQGWYVTLTGGDPHKDAAKWDARSPERFAHLLSGPLLLTHGTKDSRVPMSESRAMYEAAKAAGKSVTYVEFEGQGHGYKGVPALAKYYRAYLEFLDKL